MAQQLIEPIVLEAYDVAIGLVFVQGAGYRVGTMRPDSVAIRNLTAAEARQFAWELTLELGPSMTPVSDALRTMAWRLDEMALETRHVDGRA